MPSVSLGKPVSNGDQPVVGCDEGLQCRLGQRHALPFAAGMLAQRGETTLRSRCCGRVADASDAAWRDADGMG
jgi:hypothetical protein